MNRMFGTLIGFVLFLTLTAVGFCGSYDGKKVLYVDSYHEGYDWSDGITAGIRSVLDGTGVDLKIVHMDTKRNTSEEFKKQAGEKVKAAIDEFKPDVVIVSDDNACKYVIVPYYKDGTLPFVFCGVNWDASIYGLPCKNVTGMLEVAPIVQLLDQLKLYAKGDRIGFLAPDNETARKEAENYKKVFNIDMTTYYATDVEDWKKGFSELENSTDMLIIDSDGGLYKDQAKDLQAFVEANSKIPSGTCYDFMAPYALIGFTKIAEEQGQWAGSTALTILDGTSPADIPVAKNEQGKLILNVKLAQKIGINIPYEVVESAAMVIE